jgi:hypothetical protein
MVSDNPAYDFMWIAGMCDAAGVANPFGHSARRISDFWAGLNGAWGNTQKWKSFRRTRHDHHPVNDATGNCEAFAAILQMAAEGNLPGAGAGMLRLSEEELAAALDQMLVLPARSAEYGATPAGMGDTGIVLRRGGGAMIAAGVMQAAAQARLGSED